MGRYLPHDDNLDLVRVNLGSTSALDDSASVKDEARIWRKKDGGAIEHRIRRNISNSDIDTKLEGVRLGSDSNFERNETAMVNAAIMGPRNPGKALSLNKPIVVDMELPVYQDFNVE
ncbi:hypothetical protein GQ44DRAFT_711214 [Phaeosphaeriaceae sp. PMI808]|nr:hypothetical protein GQ44DRAFT_711214 [Phaeosphaeriaceae sp. PMI808]